MSQAIQLKEKTSRTVKPIPPYNFDPTICKPAYYPTPLEIYKPGKYWFAMRLDNKIYGVVNK